MTDLLTNRPHPTGTDKPFHTLRLLEGLYFGIGLAALAAAFLMRHNHAEVNAAVWIRSGAVLLTALILFSVTALASRGNRGAFIRLRVLSLVYPAAVVVLLVLPGDFPLWMKFEQAICGLVLAAIAVVANGRRLRVLFAR